MLGWLIGNASSDVRVRRWSTVAAVLPDIDGLTYLVDPVLYADYHHTFGHNVFLGFLVATLAAVRFRSWVASLLISFSFASHLLTDAYFSGWEQYLFWPFSRTVFIFPGSFDLKDPINIDLMYLGFVLVLGVVLFHKRTPIELISPSLDRLLRSVLQPKAHRCSSCNRRTNQICSACGSSVCWHHAQIRKGFLVTCPTCSAKEKAAPLVLL